MLDTHFPRPLGDVGNHATWPFPVRYATVPAATVARVVSNCPDHDLLEPLLEAAGRLVSAGADLITTSCGYLVLWQHALSAALPVPVISSSLLQIPLLQAALPAGHQLGVITFDSHRLGPGHLAAAGISGDIPIEGIEQGQELYRIISGDLSELDTRAACADVLDAGVRLQRRVPHLAAVVLECTNMGPYAAALRHRLNLPVFDLVSLLCGLRRSGLPRNHRHDSVRPAP